ncbi:MAG: hypothetical protein IKB73_00445 [Ruminococcus sp.]|nr:hypothetical protein [Ruminococcus sp.]
MKKLLSLVLVVLFCFSFAACKSKDDSTATTKAQKSCTEQTIKQLMEKNLDCYYLFYVTPLSHTTQQNSDGYYGNDKSYLSTYEELENLVYGTYTDSTAKKLLSHPKSSTPLYKNSNGEIFINPDVIKPVEYNILWDENYLVTIDENTKSKCTFTLKTVDLDNKEYSTDGTAVYENGNWVFSEIVY